MKKWATICIALVIVAGLVVGGFFYVIANEYPGSPMTVVWNYTGRTGVRTLSRPDYAWFVECYGEPDRLELLEPEHEKWRHRIRADFGELTVQFLAYEDELENGELWQTDTITTRNPKHRFGFWRVHVGSSREQVQRAYRFTINIWSSAAKDSFVDGDWEEYVDFYYDKNGIVTSIEFTWGM